MSESVVVVDAGYCQGYGTSPSDYGACAALHHALCGVEPNPRGRAYSGCEELVRHATNHAAPGSKWWVKLDDGRVVSGFADGSGVRFSRPAMS